MLSASWFPGRPWHRRKHRCGGFPHRKAFLLLTVVVSFPGAAAGPGPASCTSSGSSGDEKWKNLTSKNSVAHQFLTDILIQHDSSLYHFISFQRISQYWPKFLVYAALFRQPPWHGNELCWQVGWPLGRFAAPKSPVNRQIQPLHRQLDPVAMTTCAYSRCAWNQNVNVHSNLFKL